MKLLCISGFILMAAGYAAAQTGKAAPVWKEHPYLYVSKADVPSILDKAKRHDWAKASLDGIRDSADKWLTRKIELPPSTGRHSVTYICQKCKETLKTLSPTQHQCPKCSEIYSGLPYDARMYGGQHDALADAAANLGLASLFWGKPEYARKSLDILLAYADKYASYPLLDNRGGQNTSAARIMDQTLNEAIWLINIAWAYDLVLGAGVGTEQEHGKVVNQLLRPSVETIRRGRRGKSNWQSWHNAGLMATALCLKDQALLDETIYGPDGFFFQMEHSVMPDGMWYEGSWSYHNYAVSALLRTAEAAHNSGIDLYSSPALKKTLEAPLRMVMPNGHLPALNDGTEGRVGGWHYEVAAARYGDPMFENVIAGAKRGGREALLIGIDSPRKRSSALTSTVVSGSGLAILRRGEQYLCLDFGPHGGGHGHMDKLSVVYYTNGQTFGVDPGRGWPYNLPIHQEWYKLTLSHNTVIVDEKPQAECEGSLVSSRLTGEYHTVTASADKCYEGVKMKRTVALGQDWMLDVFDVESDAEHTYDWVWHGRGELSTGLPVVPSALKASHASYGYLSNIRKGDGTSDWKAEWTLPKGKVYGLFKGSSGRTAILCDAPDNPRTNTLHSVILRDRAKSARFITLFSTRPMGWGDLPEPLRRSVL